MRNRFSYLLRIFLRENYPKIQFLKVYLLGSGYNLDNYLFELFSEIFKREETMRGIKAFVIDFLK